MLRLYSFDALVIRMKRSLTCTYVRTYVHAYISAYVHACTLTYVRFTCTQTYISLYKLNLTGCPGRGFVLQLDHTWLCHIWISEGKLTTVRDASRDILHAKTTYVCKRCNMRRVGRTVAYVVDAFQRMLTLVVLETRLVFYACNHIIVGFAYMWPVLTKWLTCQNNK